MDIGRYRIVRELGRGAMGVVYLATDPAIGRQVAIKTIRLGDVSKPEERARLRERLFREARSAGVLSHPGIVTIYDMQAEDDVAYIAMEYVDGPTLDQILSGAPLAAERMFSLLGQTAVALDYAHSKGIVHRDIKPANIMVTQDGSVKITDFGIAKINTSDQFTLTGAIVGTPHYMAPEQVQGQPVDGHADQFSLAVIVFEMLTGEKPFTGDQLTTVVYKIVAEEPAAPHRLNSTLNQQITNVLRKGLAKKPEARYANCQKFVDALEAACATTKGWKALARGGSLSLPTAVEARRPVGRAALSASTEETKPSERRRAKVVPVILAVLVAAGLVMLIAWQAAPWLTDSVAKPAPATASQPAGEETPAPAAAGPEEKKPSPMPPATAASETEAARPQGTPSQTAAAEEPQTEPTPALPKPAPPKPAVKAAVVPPPKVAEHKPAPRPVTPDTDFNPYVSISVSTIPEDSTAMLDHRPDSACTTPCALDATPGPHVVSISRAGYQTENRNVTVTDAPVQLPPVALRVPSGVLMLSSVPAGAKIYLNGKAADQSTPAKLDLAPGKYNITVEKDGKRASEEVDVVNGTTRYMRIPLGH